LFHSVLLGYFSVFIYASPCLAAQGVWVTLLPRAIGDPSVGRPNYRKGLAYTSLSITTNCTGYYKGACNYIVKGALKEPATNNGTDRSYSTIRVRNYW